MTVKKIAWEFGGVKGVFDESTNQKLKRLAISSAGGANVYKTLHDIETDTDYVVPAGKKLTIIGLTTINVSNLDGLIYSDTVDASVNPVDILRTSKDIENSAFISSEIPAGKYLNGIWGTTNTTREYDVYAIEEDV